MKISFKNRLIIYHFAIVAIIIATSIIFILQRKKDYSLSAKQQELISYNQEIYKSHKSGLPFKNIDLPDDIRLTILDSDATVIYDNNHIENIIGDNHSGRKELLRAAVKGEASILRHSETIGKDLLYYVKKYPEFYIRTAAVHTDDDFEYIKRDRSYIFLLLGLLAFAIVSALIISKKLNKPFNFFSDLVDNMGYSKNSFKTISSKDVIETYYAKDGSIGKQISNNIAHELKTPITGIRGYLETILRDDNMDIEQIKKFTQKAYYQTLRLSSLVNDVSILNKIEENSQKYLVENLNLYSCLKEIEEELEHKLKENNTTITTNINSNNYFRGCYQLIYSLFKNLIDNTIEHGGKNTNITIFQNKEDLPNGHTQYSFIFSDNGVGVPEEAIEKLFERYYIVNNNVPAKKGISGLGLAIVKNAVLFHNGKISVENNPNGGLVFRFNLIEIS